MKLVEEWRKFYALYSVQIMLVLGLISAVQTNWDVVGFFVPDDWKPAIVAIMAFAAVLARFIPQPKVIAEAEVLAVEAALKKDKENG